MEFDRRERLLVYKPENITSTERELKIAKAQKLKWLYVPYGSAAMGYTAVTYTAEGSRFLKETKYGTERLTINEPRFAVYIG